jgi:hypothetical protein
MNGKTSGPAAGKIGKSEDLMLPYCAVYIDMPVQESMMSQLPPLFRIGNETKSRLEKRVCVAD